jgi:GNAT superfamily N-acetyltransferase
MATAQAVTVVANIGEGTFQQDAFGSTQLAIRSRHGTIPPSISVDASTSNLPQERRVIVRDYRPEDRTAVIALFRAFMQELTPPQLACEFAAYVDTAIREELGRIPDYYLIREDQGFWVAEENGVIGMVGIEQHQPAVAELRRMTVDAAQRRRGVGRALLAAAEAFCRRQGYRRLILSTSELQRPARQLYESSGYRLEREERDAPGSHKSAGAGLTRYHYGKML